MFNNFYQACPVGPEANLLKPGYEQCKRVYLYTPIVSPSDLIVLTQTTLKGWKVCYYLILGCSLTPL